MAHNQDDPEFIAHELALLRRRLRGRYNHIDEHLLDGSIEDALLHYRAYPDHFDASRGVPLECYLSWRTRGYLSMALRKEKRHQQHEKAAGVREKNFEKIVSEVRAGRSIYIGRDGSERETEEREEELDRERELLSAIVASLAPCEQAELQLLLAGASRNEWVQHLGIAHLPPKEQQRKVNAEKDRLKKKLKRRAQKMQGGGVAFG